MRAADPIPESLNAMISGTNQLQTSGLIFHKCANSTSWQVSIFKCVYIWESVLSWTHVHLRHCAHSPSFSHTYKTLGAKWFNQSLFVLQLSSGNVTARGLLKTNTWIAFQGVSIVVYSYCYTYFLISTENLKFLALLLALTTYLHLPYCIKLWI